ncbi:hypothetical protein C8A01DRAFT_46755 [Parachaetomium inaequale]|uniref:Uncharacterized protein n=1 Tax=Parachaetomium inaequale TaxID=2588326 RepID=A0AAN6SRQ9_9PEZI|nr:hypothetical protein C8A01DRAFT_46755 [Parachaetomium inaequale]
MPTGTFEYFFDLPPELREQILAHICVFPTGIWVGGGDDGETSVPLPRSSSPGATIFTQQPTTTTRHADSEDEEDEHADPPVNLFLASPVLYRAAGDLYYGRNVFHLDFSSHAWGRKQKSLVAAADGGSGGALWRLVTHPDTARARRRMRSVVVYVRRLGELVAGVLAPALGDMVLNGGLKRVRVDLLELGVRGRGGMGTGDYAGNPALRALLVLLTDPNLEGAGLRVLREQHAWFWCRFHRGGGVPSSSSPQDGGRVEGGGGCVMTRRNGGLRGGFVEVDIPRLVAVCAGDSAEFNIKKVG